LQKRILKEMCLLFPIMTLKDMYKLKYGTIGPASKLITNYPWLSKILPSLEKINIDGEKIYNPVFAISNKEINKFIDEIDCLAFLAASIESTAEEEIFGNKIMFTIYDKDNEDLICINNYIILPIENLNSLKLQDFPREYFRWDVEKILDFELFFKKIIKEGFYKALIKCISDEQDKELRREKARIIISIKLFNEAFVKLSLTQPFSNIQVILIASAFEALLNLSPEAISASFVHAISILVGENTSLFKKWCKDFYNYRSSLVHGDLEWNTNEINLKPFWEEGPSYSFIARNLFTYCLETKLFLMGMFPEFKRQSFGFEKEMQRYSNKVSQKVVFPQ